MKSSQILAIVIAVLALLWIGSGFLSTADPTNNAASPNLQQQHAQTANSLQKVRVRRSIAEPYTNVISVTGRSQASRNVIIRSELEGEITAIHKEEGQHATRDEILAEIDIQDRKARVNEAKERVKQRQIEYNAAKELAHKGFNSKVRLAQSLADLENAKAALKSAELDVLHTRIPAPFDGIIAEQNIEIGDFMSVGDPIFTIVDLDPIEIQAFVSEQNIHSLNLGQAVKIDVLNREEISGEISYIAPAADPQTRTFRIIISAQNEDFTLKDGLTSTVKIPTKDQLAHKISPSILALNDVGNIGVKIVDNTNTVRFVSIDVLSSYPDHMWINNLPQEVKIITIGQDYVRDGQVVEPVLSDGEGLL